MDNKTRKIATALSGRFSVNDNFYLEKALTFLKQFQHGAVSKRRKNVKASEIHSLTPQDIHYIRLNLQDSFGYSIIDISDTYDEDNIVEFVYRSNESLGTAIALLEFIKSGKDKRLTLKDGEFFYRDNLLELRKDTNLYHLLKAVFRVTFGNSGIISYSSLLSDLRKNGIFVEKNDAQIKQLIYRNLTLKGYELSEKIQTQFQETEPLFNTVDKIGLRFLNDK